MYITPTFQWYQFQVQLFIRIVVFLMNQWCINSFSRLVKREENISVVVMVMVMNQWCINSFSRLVKREENISVVVMVMVMVLNTTFNNISVVVVKKGKELKCSNAWGDCFRQEMNPCTICVNIHKYIVSTFIFGNIYIYWSLHIACSSDKINTYHVYVC